MRYGRPLHMDTQLRMNYSFVIQPDLPSLVLPIQWANLCKCDIVEPESAQSLTARVGVAFTKLSMDGMHCAAYQTHPK